MSRFGSSSPFLRTAMPPKRACSQLGDIEESAATFCAHIQYKNEQRKLKNIRGPRRTSQRRAESDLAAIRAAADGQPSRTEGIEAMGNAAQLLQAQAQCENRVALGIYQYETQRMAHKTEDSDPDSGGDDDDGYEDPYADIDVKAFVKQLEEQQDKNIVQKPPPTDANDATVQMACFQPIKESPEALRTILAARAGSLIFWESAAPLGPSFF